MKIIYVASGILIDDNNNILLEKNNSTTIFNNYWQFPGGKLESNETPLMALKREIYEELNVILDPPSITPFNFIENKNNINNEDINYIVFFYLCKKWQQTIIPKINQELQWININNLNSVKVLPNNFAIIEQLKQLKI